MDLNRVKERLKNASHVVVITGAGVSAESGIPTFRGKDGLWKQYRAEELATPEAFARNPELVWEWYCWRRGIISKAKPNPGHMAIAELEKRYENFLLITQNVDGLHRAAGSNKLVEIHGNIWQTRCVKCNTIEQDNELDFRKIGVCGKCGGQKRPNVVWFNESIPTESLNKALSATTSCNLMIVAGTSGIVQPTASLPFMAKQSGAFVVEVNIDPTPISDIADVFIRGKSGEVLPKLLD
ncbi:MAG: SIR2 family NAD-dependent protein deacylase [bacterium]